VRAIFNTSVWLQAGQHLALAAQIPAKQKSGCRPLVASGGKWQALGARTTAACGGRRPWPWCACACLLVVACALLAPWPWPWPWPGLGSKIGSWLAPCFLRNCTLHIAHAHCTLYIVHHPSGSATRHRRRKGCAARRRASSEI
jgi:hypothetical protein